MFNLPLKTEKNPKGVYTEQELYMVLCLMFVAIFFDVDPSKSFPLKLAALKSTRQFGDIVTLQVKALKKWKFLHKKFSKDDPDHLESFGRKLIQRFLDSGSTPEEVAWQYVVPTAGASAPNQAIVFAQVLDFYLQPENAQHLAEIQRLAAMDTIESFETIKKYALEGTRLAGTFGLYRRVDVDEIQIEDMGRELNFKKDDMLFISFVSSNALQLTKSD